MPFQKQALNMIQKLSWIPLRWPTSFSEICCLGAKVLKGGKRQAGILSEIAKWVSNASTCLFVEDRVMSFNSAGIQVHPHRKAGS